MTDDPVLHALVDLCEAIGRDMPLRHPYDCAMKVISERSGLQPEAAPSQGLITQMSASAGISFDKARELYDLVKSRQE